MTDETEAQDNVTTLRCQDCGSDVDLLEEYNECECGSAWVRQWKFQGEAVVELWWFLSTKKPARRRRNGRE